MDPVSHADELQRSGRELINSLQLEARLRRYGEVEYVGSFALDLMAWTDIDIHMVLSAGDEDLSSFFQLGAEIAGLAPVEQLKFSNLWKNRPPGWEPGLYWGIRIARGPEEIPWKVDLWATDEPVFQRRRGELARVKGALDETSRRLILEIKQTLLTPEGRTPIGSGHRICEAVLFEGLRTIEEVCDYLVREGVSLK